MVEDVETRTVLASELKPAMWVFDTDNDEWLEVVRVERRFGLALVTVEDSAGRESTWPLLVDRELTVETATV